MSVRARLLTALALLALATLVVGAIAWGAMTQMTGRVDRLHRDTLAEVDAALSLSREAAGIATRAPYMLTLDSPFRITQEGTLSIALIDAIAADLPPSHTLHATLQDIRDAVGDLVAVMQDHARLRDRTLRINAELAALERRFAAESAENHDAFALQRIATALLAAGRAENLISLGEFHREFYHLTHADTAPVGLDALSGLKLLTEGPEGLLETRRLELARLIDAEAALVRIRQGAAAVIGHAETVTAEAQNTIAREREATTSAISVQKSVILFVGLASAALALAAALYVTGYVTGNLRAVSEAMMRLAAGDRSSRLPRGEGAGDEIGKLFHAFRTFRANALRLDRSNRQMEKRTALFEKMMAGISDGVAIMSDTGAILARNDRLAKVLRIDPAKVDPRNGLDDLIAMGGWTVAAGLPGVAQLSSPDGHHAERRESPLPGGGAVVLISDTSEQRQFDERLQQIQRIEALGKVTGEVAHDFGNILSTITASLHLMEHAPEQEQHELRASIANATDLGAALVERLLAFARRQRLVPEVIELNTLVDGVADLITFALRDEITLDIRPYGTPLSVRVDPGQLESALLNLCLNAGQAIEDAGQITITIGETAGMAEIKVTDTGRGMSPEVRRHAMEPFFSSRDDGAGTGLGLAMVYGFIRQSGGDVQIQSAEGRGTTIRLILPRDLGETPALAFPWRRVLLVEDNARDRAAALAALNGSVTEVTACTTADAALVNLERHNFDLVLTDLFLGGVPLGWDIAEAALRRNASTRVAVVSGHLPESNPHAARFGSRIVALPKPLDLGAITSALSVPDAEAAYG